MFQLHHGSLQLFFLLHCKHALRLFDHRGHGFRRQRGFFGGYFWYFSVRILERHLPERCRNILHIVADAEHQLLRHLRGHVLRIAHCGKSFLREVSFNESGDRQLRGHELQAFLLHGVLVVEHIDLDRRRFLVDAPASARRLPQRKELVAHAVEHQRRKGVEIQAGFYQRRVCDQHLHPGGELFLHPVLTVGGLDLVGQDLRAAAFIRQELFELLLRIRAHPACVDERTLPVLNSGFYDFQRPLFLFSERIRIPDVLRFDNGYIAVGVENGLLVIRLIRIDSQQIQIRGKDLLRHTAV